MPGCNACARVIVPYLSSASAQVAGVPGTPTDMPLKRASLNGSGAPFSQKDVGVIAAVAFSRPSIVVTWPPAVRITMKPPPPRPHENGSVTPSTPAATTAASTALPPAFNSSIAACVASVSTDAAAPPVPTDVGGPDGATAAAATRPKTSAAAIVRTKTIKRSRCRLITPSSVEQASVRPYRTCGRLVLGEEARRLEQVGLVADARVRTPARRAEPGCDDRHPDLAGERLVDRRAEDDVRVVGRSLADHLRRLVDLDQRQVVAPGNREQDSLRARQLGFDQR